MLVSASPHQAPEIFCDGGHALRAHHRAAKCGVIAGAAVDVTDPEPLPKDHPLWGAPNLILTPQFPAHAGRSGTQRMAAVAEDNLKRFMRGDTLTNIVTL